MEKLKVILIDDETLVRKLIRMKIDWEALQMEVVAEFSSSQKALQEAPKWQPDIIITDICMPGMDGIALSRELLKILPQVKIMVLTGYDEFSYAKESVSIGISDYLLKPINGEEVTKSLQKVKEKIKKERLEREDYEALAATVEENIPIYCEAYLNQVLLTPQPSDAFIEKMRSYKKVLNPLTSKIQVAVLAIRQCEMIAAVTSMATSTDASLMQLKAGIDDKSYGTASCEPLLYMEVSKITKLFFSGDSYLFFYRDGLGKVVILSNNPELPLKECLILLVKKLKDELACQVSIGMGGVRADYSEIAISYAQALQALNYQLNREKEGVACYEALEGLEKEETARNEEEKEGIADSVSMEEYKQSELVREILKYMSENLSDPELSMNKVAEHIFISAGYLGRLLKKYTGKTYGEYLSEIRFNRVKALLKTTDLKGYEIGEKIGILDAHYLSIWFKKMSGYSLSEYRRLIQCSKSESMNQHEV